MKAWPADTISRLSIATAARIASPPSDFGISTVRSTEKSEFAARPLDEVSMNLAVPYRVFRQHKRFVPKRP